jgi:hypothetical protein
MHPRHAARQNRVRVALTPPGGDEAGVVSVWAEANADRTSLVLAAEVPGVAPGWGVAGRAADPGQRFAGEVTAVTGRTLAVEVSP